MTAAEQRPVTALRGVGPALGERLRHLGVAQVQDLLFVLPRTYEDRTRMVPIGALAPGTRAVIEGEVQLTEVTFRRRRQLLSRLADGSGHVTLRFFHFSASQQAGLARGSRLRCYGEVRRGPLGLEIVHPEYRHVAAAGAPLEETLTPIYPTTEGVAQARLRALIGQALGKMAGFDQLDLGLDGGDVIGQILKHRLHVDDARWAQVDHDLHLGGVSRHDKQADDSRQSGDHDHG